MTTYYAAQLGIALSVVDCKASYLDSLQHKQRALSTASSSSDVTASPAITPVSDDAAHAVAELNCADDGVKNHRSVSSLLSCPEEEPSSVVNRTTSPGSVKC